MQFWSTSIIFALFPKSKIIYFLPPPVNEIKAKNAGKNLTNVDIKQYYDAAKKVCEDNSIAYIDSFAVFKPLLDAGRDYHVEDGVHLTDQAYEIIASELVKSLIQTHPLMTNGTFILSDML